MVERLERAAGVAAVLICDAYRDDIQGTTRQERSRIYGFRVSSRQFSTVFVDNVDYLSGLHHTST